MSRCERRGGSRIQRLSHLGEALLGRLSGCTKHRLSPLFPISIPILYCVGPI